MKKVLFASTALVAFAGAAAADVTLSGSAEMGIMDTNAVGTDVQFVQDIDVTFTMSGETDGGLSFGAAVDLDESAGNVGADDAGVAVFISGDFGTLTMGDTDGAADWAMTEVALAGGSLNDNETGHAGYNGNAGLDGTFDGQVLRYDYSFGSFGVAVSAEISDNDASNAQVATTATNSDVLGIGFKYDLDLGGTTIALGLGHQTASINNVDRDFTGISAKAGFGGGFSAAINYSVLSVAGVANDVKHMGVGVGYTNGPIAVGLNYGEYDRGSAATDSDGYGLAVAYDLGGGASVKFGYGSGSTGTAASVNAWSLGVAMSF